MRAHRGLSFGPDAYGTTTIQIPIEQAVTDTCSALCRGGGSPAQAKKAHVAMARPSLVSNLSLWRGLQQPQPASRLATDAYMHTKSQRVFHEISCISALRNGSVDSSLLQKSPPLNGTRISCRPNDDSAPSRGILSTQINSEKGPQH
jgi:hypothetical protein